MLAISHQLIPATMIKANLLQLSRLSPKQTSILKPPRTPNKIALRMLAYGWPSDVYPWHLYLNGLTSEIRSLDSSIRCATRGRRELSDNPFHISLSPSLFLSCSPHHELTIAILTLISIHLHSFTLRYATSALRYSTQTNITLSSTFKLSTQHFAPYLSQCFTNSSSSRRFCRPRSASLLFKPFLCLQMPPHQSSPYRTVEQHTQFSARKDARPTRGRHKRLSSMAPPPQDSH